jgi:hypothetical protein
MFRHQPEADRRRRRDSWTRASRAAVPFRVGAPEGRSPALPFHISSRANAGRDRDESSEADSLRRAAFTRPDVARDDESVLAVLLVSASGVGRIETASSNS